ncbi:MAG: hypothetical protein M1814_002502 [Vezdaea aestivalis]|nr:MAG: hypothetical protein M1814_002502 [Vezdaea aestivalis]
MPSDFRSVEELCAYEPGRTHTLGTICLNPVAERSSHVCDRGLADEALWESEPLQRFCWASCYCSEDAVSDQDRQTLRERLNYARMLGDKPRSEDYEYPSDAETEDDYPSRQYEGTVYANSATALDLWWVRLTKGRSRANTRVCAPGTRGRKCASPRRPSAVVRQGQLTKALTAESTIQGICGIKCQRRRDGSLGCAGSVAGACACAAVWVGTGLWDLGGCRHKIGGGSRGKRDEGAWACPCNATYVSAGCCGNTDGVVYEAAEMRLGRLI